MYLGSRKPKRQDSPWRVLTLVILIVCGVYIIREQIGEADWTRPFDPTATPTRSAEHYFEEAETFPTTSPSMRKLDSVIISPITLDPSTITFNLKGIEYEGKLTTYFSTVVVLLHTDKAGRSERRIREPDSARSNQRVARESGSRCAPQGYIQASGPHCGGQSLSITFSRYFSL